MIKEISAFIASETPFILGDTLQVAHRTPDSPDQCSVVLESGGSTLHPDLPDRVDKMIQVISRAATYKDAHDDAWTIYKALYPDLTAAGLPGGSRTTSAVAPATQDYEAMTITPMADPQYTGRDEKKLFEFSCNYLFRLQNA
ncbi:hypothetical protein KA005_80770 [bacterium]|nr:hypothetical protein [bacterium]